MENIELQQEQTPAENICIHCGIPLQYAPARTPLCDDCRVRFIKFPIPTWIKIFGIAIAMVLIFSVFSLSGNVKTGIHYKRGMNAASQKNYFTAQNEFQQVVRSEPNYKEGEARLLIAAFYNGDMETMRNAFQKIQNEEFDKDELYNEVSSVISKAGNYVPSDSFMVVLQKHNLNIDSIPETEYTDYLTKNNSDFFACCAYASWLQDQKKYRAADSVLSSILILDPEHKTALTLKVPVKRELDQIDSAYYYVGRILNINHEDIYAMASKVRVLLKEKKDDEALQLAKECVRMNDQDIYSLCSLALAYHFKNDIHDRDAIMERLAKDSSAASSLPYVKDIIEGKEIFRN